MSLKNTFTLLVPTYNRYPYLLRLLKYYQSFSFPFEIHILDSSSDELASKELGDLIKLEEIHYHKYDPNILAHIEVFSMISAADARSASSACKGIWEGRLSC